MALFLRRPSSTPDTRRGSVSPDYHFVGFRRQSSPEAHSIHSTAGLVYVPEDDVQTVGVYDVELPSPSSDTSKRRLTWAHSEDSTIDGTDEEPSSLFEKLSDFYDRYGLRHVTPIVLLAIYSVMGAAIFLAIERDSDKEHVKNVNRQIAQAQESTARNITSLLLIDSGENIHNRTLLAIKRLTEEIALIAEVSQSIHPEPMWTFSNALLYVGTLYTTIGYGNIYAKTTGGQVVTIFYCFLGIPLMLAILGDLGSLLADWLTKLWNMFMDKLHKAMPEKIKIPLNLTSDPMRKLSSSILADAQAAKITAEIAEQEKDEVVMPASAAISFALLWLIFCSVLMISFDTNFKFFDAFYFFFISLTTIGLGDVVPADPQYLIANFWAIIVGLIIVAMCISVIQERIEYFFYKLMLMIEKKYMELMEKEANGEITDRQKRKLMKKFMRGQPFMTRHVAPRFFGKTKSDDFHNIVRATTQKEPEISPTEAFKTLDQKPRFFIPLGTKEKACQTKPISRPMSQVTFSEVAQEFDPPFLSRTSSVDVPVSFTPDSVTEYDNDGESVDQEDPQVPRIPELPTFASAPSIPSICIECEAEESMQPGMGPPVFVSEPFQLAASCQTDVPMVIDQQVMVDSRLLEHTDVHTQVDPTALGERMEVSEESQTNIASILCELTIVSPRPREPEDSDLLNLVIDPENMMHDIMHDTQTQTPAKDNLDSSAQTPVTAMYDVYQQIGPALNDFRDTAAETFILQFSQEAQTDDDLADAFFDSSSDSYSLNESPSLPIILEEDELECDDVSVESWEDKFLAMPESPDEFPANKLDPNDGELSALVDSGTVSDDVNGSKEVDPSLISEQSQTSDVQQNNRSTQTALVVPLKKQTSSNSFSKLFTRKAEPSISYIDQATTMHDDFAEFLKEGLVDREVQTVDSYLKLAKGLARLSRNRAASLKIMAAPGIRNNKLAQKMKKLEDKSNV